MQTKHVTASFQGIFRNIRYEKIWMQRYSEKGYVHILHTVHSAAGVLYSAKEALTRIYIYIYIDCSSRLNQSTGQLAEAIRPENDGETPNIS